MSLFAPAPEIAHTVALASAGAGKTHALTSRYIALLASGEAPTRILATTFTRKAAGEILEKVVQRLAAGAASPEAAAKLAEQVGLRALAPQDCARLLALVVRNLDRLNVGTIDSFFMRAAACFAMEMGGAPTRLADEHADATLRDEAVSEVLADGDPADLSALLMMLEQGQCVRSVHGALRRSVDGAYSIFGETAEGTWSAIAAPPGRLQAAELARAIKALRALDLPTTRSTGTVNVNWQKAVDGAIAAAAKDDWEGFIADTLVERIAAQETSYSQVEIPKPVAACYAPLIRHARAHLLGALADRNRAAFQLLGRFDRAYRRLKRERGLFTFEDIPRLLLECRAFETLDDLAYRLDAKIGHVLLDEFQDTSIQQWSLLSPLVEEIVANRPGGAGARSFLCVGDVKQSLYSWRGGEPELLGSLRSRWPHLGAVDLLESYRSSKVVIDTVNKVFSALGGGAAFSAGSHDDSGVVTDWTAAFKEHRAAKNLPGSARLLAAPAAVDKDDQPITTLRFVAERIKALHDSAPGVTIGVLFRTRKNIRRLKRLLHDAGVAVSEEGGNPLTDSMPVAVAMSMLTLADHPGNSAAHFHVFNSPLGRLLELPVWEDRSGVRRFCARVRRSLVDDGYARTLEGWRAGIAPSCDRHGLDRFERLIDLAVEFDRDPGLRPGEFAAMVASRRIEDPGAGAVRLMTIHASKGLEFGIVVLPDLDCQIAQKYPKVLSARESPAGPITAVSICPKKALIDQDDGLRDMYRSWRSRQVREEVCILYVALTRAVHALEMIICPTEKSEGLTFGGILRSALAPGKPAVRGRELWRHGDEHWARGLEARPTRKSAGPAPSVRAQLPATARQRFLARQSPATLGGKFAGNGLPRKLAPDWDAARSRGMLFHAWLELIEWVEDGAPSEAELIRAGARIGHWTEAEVKTMISTFNSAVAAGELREALSRSRYADRYGQGTELAVWRERSFVLNAPGTLWSPALLSGRFDRLVFGRERSSGEAVFAEVLDFKTSGPSAPLEHADQMTAYRSAAARLLGLDEEKVATRVVFLGGA